MTNIPKKFQFAGKRKIIKQGNSIVITIPSHLIESEGIKRGDKVNVYSDGDGLMVVDLKPEDKCEICHNEKCNCPERPGNATME